MARRSTIVRPRCVHHAALMAEYDARCEQYWKAPEGDRPVCPPVDGYCADCYAALQQPDAIWPKEIGTYLDAQAAADYHPSKLPTWPKLPPAPAVRRESIDAWHARAMKRYSLTPAQAREDTRAVTVIGQACDRTGAWVIETTNGHVALVRRGSAPTAGAARLNLIDGYGEHWIDLPPDFYLALQRVRCLANERSHAIKLAYAEGELVVSAKSEIGSASERLGPLITSETDLPGYEVLLDAEYLEAACGIWPLRWYLRPPETRERPATRFERGDAEGRVRWTEQVAQVFEPAGSGYRVAIMPMRE